jgi:hypothetical protein
MPCPRRGVGSQHAVPATPPDAPRVPPPPSDETALPPKVQLAIDSKPRGAQVIDLATGSVMGKTPTTIPVTPGHKPRQYKLVLRGYSDAVVEVVPDQAQLERMEVLDRGTTGVVRPPVVTPDAGGSEQKSSPQHDGKPDAAPKGPDDDCPELPCLKQMPTPPPPPAAPAAPAAGSGSG